MNPKKETHNPGRREIIIGLVLILLALTASLIIVQLNPYRPPSTFIAPAIIMIIGIILTAVMVVIDITWRKPPSND